MVAPWRHVPADTGATMGKYVLGKRIGAGGMGVVYEAAAGGRCVAIKFPYSETLDDEYTSRRFRDEGVAGSIVTHPNLAHVVDHGTHLGIPYVVMERVRGEALGDRIEREGQLSLRRVAMIVRQVLDGLDALHAAGIVHADVKSDNVLVVDIAGREVAKLIDFGLAHADLEDRTRPSPDDMISGTPDYMAPEVVRGEGSTPASDLYAAGIILYELITGTTPFAGGNASQIMNRQLDEDVIPPSLRRPDRDVPPILERIVLRALEKDPAMRFPSAAAFASALAVALPCLGDDMVPLHPTAFATDSPTLDWHVRDTIVEPPRRRLARGTPGVRRRRR